MILNGELYDMKVSRTVRRAVDYHKGSRPTLLFFMVKIYIKNIYKYNNIK